MDAPTAHENPFSRIRLRYLALALVVGIVAATGVLELIRELGVPERDALNVHFFWVPFYLVVGGWLAVSLTRQRIDVRHLLGGPPDPRYLRVSLGVVTTSVFLVLALYALLYVRLAPPGPPLDEPTSTLPLPTRFPDLFNILAVILVVLCGPVIEELLFRGVLLHRWAAIWNVRVAVIATSLLFGAIHFDMVGMFVFGLLLSRLYLRSRSLHVPIFCHMLYNAVEVITGFRGVGPTGENQNAIFTVLRDNPWIGLSCLAVSFPLVLYYLRLLEVSAESPLPYFDRRPSTWDDE